MADQTQDRFLRLNEVRHRTGLSTSTIWRLERDGTFPLRVRIGGNSVAWSETEIIDWMNARLADRGAA